MYTLACYVRTVEMKLKKTVLKQFWNCFISARTKRFGRHTVSVSFQLCVQCSLTRFRITSSSRFRRRRRKQHHLLASRRTAARETGKCPPVGGAGAKTPLPTHDDDDDANNYVSAFYYTTRVQCVGPTPPLPINSMKWNHIKHAYTRGEVTPAKAAPPYWRYANN